MLVASGTLLVLLTWACGALALLALGLPAAVATSAKQPNAAPVLRRALWWGLLIVAILSYLVNLVLPLHDGTTAVLFGGLAVVFGVWGWWLLRRRGSRLRVQPRPVVCARWPWVVLWVVLALSLVYLAAAALGPVTNYDSGLYHLGAIKYATEFPTVPGLANLYYPLGYGNAEFPLAALLGNGPWQGEGYRLLNGLVMFLAVLDLALRARQRRLGPGFFVPLAGILAAWVPMVALSDYWVTSPTQDSSVFVITVIVAAYLSDAALGRTGWVGEAAVAVALGILLILLRPTMLVFAAAVVAAVAVMAWRRRGASPQGFRAAIGVLAAGAVAAAIAATLRDRLLSGWLQFPLSIHAFDVPWLATDPTMDRLATLGYHRNADALWESTTGWAWVGPWLANRWSQWETYEFLGLLLVTVIAVVLVHRMAVPARWRAAALAWAPFLVATAFWWAFTPPSYRFAWGLLFSLCTVPLGWAVWLLTTRDPVGARRAQLLPWTLVATAVPILLVTGFSAVARFDVGSITASREWTLLVTVPYAVAPVVDAPIQEVSTASGLTLLQPTTSDQCWDYYPLCTPRPTPTLRLRGDDLAGGFLP